VASAEVQQEPAQRDVDRREKDVEGDVGRELDARKQECVHDQAILPDAGALPVSAVEPGSS
jgi:hypothetical protein